MVQLFSWKNDMIVLWLLLWCVKDVAGFMLAITFRRKAMSKLKDQWNARGIFCMSCWNQRLQSPYTHCWSQIVVLDTVIFLPICRLPLKDHTYQRLGFQSSAGWALLSPHSWAKMDIQTRKHNCENLILTLFYSVLLKEQILQVSGCIYCITSHSHLSHLHLLYPLKLCAYTVYNRCQGFHVDIGLHVCR